MRGHHAWRMRHAGARRTLLSAAAVVLLGAILIPTANAGASTPKVKNPICSHLGQLGVSAGAHVYCHGPFKPFRPSRVSAGHRLHPASSAPANVDAASTAEDVAPSGVRGYGQSEESVAAVGKYVVEAWNDSTSFSANCGAPEFKEELTGYGFSADGGKTFRDEGGLPNAACSSGWFFQGDPSVEGLTRGGKTYFYVSSLYVNFNTGQSDIALDACQVTGSGTGAVLSCNLEPTIVATGASGDFLDKDYLSIDPRRGRLYATFSRFSFPSASNGQIELAACDISGARAANPICFPGSFNSPYYVVQSANPNCENEGAYSAVNTTNGDVYVAWEFNWATNLFTTACFGVPTRERLAYVPNSCLDLSATSPCTSPAPVRASVKIVSMDSALIPGYNRFPMNDFPRIAVSPKAGTVTIVFNDASKPTGKILMQSYDLLSSSSTSFTKVQSHPVQLNNNKGPTWVFMPGLRNANSSGQLDVIWFDRRKSNPSCEACTDVFAAMHVSPTATMTPTANVRITNVTSNWNAQSSDIVPNFGDYTDDFVAGALLYAAWADGRIGEPQPFSAHTAG
ncbi:MAG: hypothetical protein JO321_16435 [Solirubrobacterales bacterium]|nr:hypothetical protein [Solirubrobacterales bacterium]